MMQRGPEALQDTLSLTERQLTELTDLRDEHNKKIQEVQGQLRDLEAQRRQQMQSAAPDAGKIGSIALQVQSLQQQLQQENTAYHENALRTLDSGQRETVAKIEEALKLAPKAAALTQFGLLDMQSIGRGMGGMFGGPGGPGGPAGMMGAVRGGQPPAPPSGNAP